jgi:HEAT repeat protein
MDETAGRQERATRPSTLVNRDDLPGVRDREQINMLLTAHDPEVAEANFALLTERHSPLLRQIAQEPVTSAVNPNLRSNAIAALARFVSADNVNLLTDLAKQDDDEVVRAHAMTALANTGLQLAAPVLADSLDSPHPIEATAARKGLANLTSRHGRTTVEALLRPGQRLIDQVTRGQTAADD